MKGRLLTSFDKPQVAIFCSIAAIALALAAGGLALSKPTSSAAPTRGTVELTETATVAARPDTLVVDLTVQVVKTTSSAALREDNIEMSTVQGVFRRAGVPKKDLSTSSFTVGKNYNTNGKAAGYVASNSLEVTLKDLAKSGAVISSAQSTVGNDVSIDDISYSLVNVNAALNAARATAVRNARAAADVLAKAAGTKVIGITKISDQSASNSPSPITFNKVATPQSKTSVPSVPLNPGTQPVTATVDIVFSLAN
jgi:hypothetical protein